MRLPICLLGFTGLYGQTLFEGRPSVVLENDVARISIDIQGGSIVEFRLKSQPVNPLRWANQGPADQARAMSHFVCLDRWGQPSEAELKNGMPFHGEATRVEWKHQRAAANIVTMSAFLPMAGLEIERKVTLDGAAIAVEESVTNRNKLGRVYNMVQHPTIGPPFLDEATVVDSNATRGLMQSSPMPDPEKIGVAWPRAAKDGQPVDMRRLTNDPLPNVVSYIVEEDMGWVLATSPNNKLIIGYLWKTSDYPWLNIWRHVQDGKPLARGLEFGTTGLHQPFPVLVKKERIFGRRLFQYLDAGETQTRKYVAFAAAVPPGFAGAKRVEASGSRVAVTALNGSTVNVEAGSALTALR
jgi:hypothetical protein